MSTPLDRAEQDVAADRAERYGQVLRRWGLLDEANDPKATEEFVVVDLLAVADAEKAAGFEFRSTAEIRGAALVEAADFLRDSHFRDGLSVQEIGTALRHMADEAQQAEADTLAAALDGLHTLIATSSRDWQTYRVDAWLWAVLCGWDCEQAEHDDTCTHGALEETAAMHGWDDATVVKVRRYRAAVRALTEAAVGAQQPKES